MFTTTKRIALTSVLVVAIFAVTIGLAAAENSSHGVQGAWLSADFSGPGCPSALGACGRGTFSGTLHGPIEVVATAFDPGPTPGLLVAIGDLVIHDSRGDVRCTATIVGNDVPTSDGEEGWICEVTGGTGHWAGVTGHLEAYGTQPPGAPATGRYSGTLNLP